MADILGLVRRSVFGSRAPNFLASQCIVGHLASWVDEQGRQLSDWLIFVLVPRFFLDTRELKFYKQTWRPEGRIWLSSLCSRDLDKDSSVYTSSCIRMAYGNSNDFFKR